MLHSLYTDFTFSKPIGVEIDPVGAVLGYITIKYECVLKFSAAVN